MAQHHWQRLRQFFSPTVPPFSSLPRDPSAAFAGRTSSFPVILAGRAA